MGLEFVRQLLADDAKGTVFATCRSPAAATDLQALREEHGDRLHVIQLDVSDESSVEVGNAMVDVQVFLSDAGRLSNRRPGRQSGSYPGSGIAEPSLTSPSVLLQAAAKTVSAVTPSLGTLINVAGVLQDQSTGLKPERSLRSISAANLQQSFAVNTIGPILVAKTFMPLLSCFGKDNE